MSLESRYVINVARVVEKRARFFFRVEETSSRIAVEVFKTLRTKFPAPAFEVTVSYWDCRGADVTKQLLGEEG